MIPSLFTVSYAGFWGQDKLSLPAVLHKAKELGYPAVEIMGKRPHLSTVDFSLRDVRSLKETIDSLGLQVACLAAYTNFTGGLESKEVPFVEMQLAYIRNLCEFADILNTRVIRVFTAYFSDKIQYENGWRNTVEAIRQACDIAAQYGIVIGIQNHHDYGVSAESYEDLLNDINKPNCRAMFDAWSIALQDSDLYYWAKRLAPRMVQTTVADYVKFPRYHLISDLSNYERLQPDGLRAVPMGQGFIDYPAFFRGLKEGGFNGYVSYEMCWPLRGGGSLANLDATAKQSLANIQQLIA